jgi:hypothetical protein
MDEGSTDRIDAMPTPERERSTVAELAPSRAAPAPDPVPAPEETLEEEYQRIGWWKGPNATRAARARQRDFWRSSGEAGVRWLVGRLRDEYHLETLHGVADLLADLGEIILGAIVEELSRGATGDQALCLLWALVSLSESDPTLRLEGARAESALVGLLQNEEPDVREAAAEAVRLLDSDRGAGAGVYSRAGTGLDATYEGPDPQRKGTATRPLRSVKLKGRCRPGQSVTKPGRSTRGRKGS